MIVAAAAVASASATIPAVAAMLTVGDAFPAWELTDDRGARISSADLAGDRYLVWFYPKASTPG
jgi:peroxiredoxin Q/BCP